MQRVRQLFNRSKKSRSKSSLKSVSRMSLMRRNRYEGIQMSAEFTTTSDENSMQSRQLKRSALSQRHLNTDGSSFDKLRKICKMLPKQRHLHPHHQHSSMNDISKTSTEAEESQQPTLKSDYSSGRELQIILEKLMDEEAFSKRPTNSDKSNDYMHEKQLNALHFNPNLNANVTSPNIVEKSYMQTESKRKEDDEETFSQASQKVRYEMMDPNEQARLFVKSRKKRKKSLHKKRQSSSSNMCNERTLKNYSTLAPALEVKRNSMTSMSSCSIDSALEDSSHVDTVSTTTTISHYENPTRGSNSKHFESISCQASQLSEDVKAALVDSYDIVSKWFACINLQVDDDLKCV